MFNIVIADDQQRIREGLRAILAGSSLPIGELYLAANGVQALELLAGHEISLVVTDIKMPDMDGIALMERARKEFPRADFLILSGYDDFQYAQKAIECGAKAYLLKPVDRESLIGNVSRVYGEWKLRQTEDRNRDQLASRVQELELRQFLLGEPLSAAARERLETEAGELWTGYSLCLLAGLRPGTDADSRIAEAAGRLFRGEALCAELPAGVAVLLRGTAQPAELLGQLEQLGLRAAAASSGPLCGLDGLPEAVRRTEELLRHRYLFPEKRLLVEGDLAPLRTEWKLPTAEIDRLAQIIGTENSGEIGSFVSGLFRRETLRQYRIGYTEALVRQLCRVLCEFGALIRPYLDEGALELGKLESLYEFPSMREYLSALQAELQKLNDFYYEFKCSYRQKQDIREAVRFIRENYRKPIDLAVVSNHVSLNYAYFSNLFKKCTGKSFVEYLRDLRLDQAKRLLAETDDKVAEIAAAVGYDSYKSFTRAFRETVGMQPTEYRRAHSREPRG